jgi:hypothetical protein
VADCSRRQRQRQQFTSLQFSEDTEVGQGNFVRITCFPTIGYFCGIQTKRVSSHYRPALLLMIGSKTGSLILSADGDSAALFVSIHTITKRMSLHAENVVQQRVPVFYGAVHPERPFDTL